MEPVLGRDEELARIEEMLGAGERLVTLVGPAGVGKSALLGVLARRSGEGVLDLGQGQAADALEAALGAHLLPGLSPEQGASLRGGLLRWALGRAAGRRLLLDVPEGAREAAAALVGVAGGLAVVAASRRPLGLAGERVVEVAALPLGGPEGKPGAAVELLGRAAERGKAKEAGALAAIARSLEGRPLALVLVGRALRDRSPQEVAALLMQPTPPLVAALDRPVRHGAAVALATATEAERRALLSLLVFSGGFDREAGEAVVASGGEGAELLSSLSDRGFVRQEAWLGGERWVVERELYGLGKSAEFLEAYQEAAQRHVAWFQRQALARWNRQSSGQGSDFELWSLRERGNLRVAIQRLNQGASPPTEQLLAACALGVGLAGATGRVALGRDDVALLEQLLLEAQRQGEAAAGQAVVGLLQLLVAAQRRAAGDAEGALEGAELALHFASRCGDGALRRGALRERALGLWRLGQTEAALSELRCAVSEHEEAGESALVTRLTLVHCLHAAGAPEPEQTERALAEAQARQDREALLVLRALGASELLAEGKLDEAEQQLEAQAWSSSLLPPFHGQMLLGLGHAALLRGDGAEAARRYRRARERMEQAGQPRGALLAQGGEGLAWLLSGDRAQARPLLSEALGGLEPRVEPLAAGLLAAALGAAQEDADEAQAQKLLEQAAARLAAAPSPRHALIARGFGLVRRLRRGDEAADAEARAVAREASGVHSEEVRLALALLEQQRSQAEAGRGMFVIDAQGQGFRPPGEAAVLLGERPVLSSVLRALAASRAQRPGAAVERQELIRSAWPDEPRLARAAAANRLHVALTTLRKLGLGPVLLHAEGGYLLDPARTQVATVAAVTPSS